MRRRVRENEGPTASQALWSSRLQAEIDELLEVDFVKWNQVHAYVGELESLLERINAHGTNAPARALDLVLYFVKEIPNIFNNVHDECELAMFCGDLAESAMALTKKAGASAREPAARLIEAYLADANDTCRFDDVPDILAKARLSRNDRMGVAEVLSSYAGKAEAQEAGILRSLSDKISGRGR